MKLFIGKFWLTAAMFLALAIMFGVYVYSEKQIDRANQNRFQSYMLADELRQSSDDLTRMARSYVVTGNLRFKKYYQEILDIRNGYKARPDGYAYIYWDFVLADGHSLQASTGQPIALFELMRQSGFTAEELQKLAESKASSDRLVDIELMAMKLAENVGTDKEASHEKAEQMMHDISYHKAKADIMRPLNELYKLMNNRTSSMVRHSERHASAFRIVFMMCCLSAVIMLWAAQRKLQKTLGASADIIHLYLLKIGQGDNKSAISVPPGSANSVLASLSDMQAKLQAHEEECALAEAKLAESEFRLRTIIDSEPECIKIVDAKGRLIMMNLAGQSLLGADSFEQISGKQIVDVIAPEYREDFAKMHKRVIAGESMQMEFEIIDLNGGRRWLETHAVPMQDHGETVHLAVTCDITERKAAAVALRESENRFHTYVDQVADAFFVHDFSGLFIDFNRQAYVSLGYSREFSGPVCQDNYLLSLRW